MMNRSPFFSFVQDMRVVQRNLVYAVGLPLEICREDILREQEYFGQYGKVVKVGHIQPLAKSAVFVLIGLRSSDGICCLWHLSNYCGHADFCQS
jgi:hypothetical protein